jgi:hypothetical protein
MLASALEARADHLQNSDGTAIAKLARRPQKTCQVRAFALASRLGGTVAVIASEAKQSIFAALGHGIASSLRSSQ